MVVCILETPVVPPDRGPAYMGRALAAPSEGSEPVAREGRRMGTLGGRHESRQTPVGGPRRSECGSVLPVRVDELPARGW